MSAPGLHPDWIVPDWPAAPAVRAFFTTRAGGVSPAPYASLNLGFATGDAPEHVAANRARVEALLPQRPRWLKQVHGARVLEAETVRDRPEADAAIAATPGTVCAIQVADCLPVLFANRAGTRVAAAHAGWRGLAGGVLDNTLEALGRAGSAPSEVMAWIGPGIGPRAFEVGEEVREAFVASHPSAAAAFVPRAPGKWLADLPRLTREALARRGVHAIYGGMHCTWSDAARFYSYRRDRDTGRMAAFVWIAP